MAIPAFSPAEIRRYYDRHTPAFVRLGDGGNLGAIHRAVWGPGVLDHAGAFRYVEDRIADLLRPMLAVQDRVHVVDLGCGVASSLCYLAECLPVHGTGITLSPVQVRFAAARIAASGLQDRVRCLEGDYCLLPAGIPPADLAFAIESFVHGPSPDRFFAEAARLVRPGGLLVVCDDVRQESEETEAVRLTGQFVRGWHVNSLLTPDALRAAAGAAGFAHESTADLSPYLQLRRPRDRAIAVLVTLVQKLPLLSRRLAPLIGGTALQTCLQRGWISYDLMVFRRNID